MDRLCTPTKVEAETDVVNGSFCQGRPKLGNRYLGPFFDLATLVSVTLHRRPIACSLLSRSPAASASSTRRAPISSLSACHLKLYASVAMCNH